MFAVGLSELFTNLLKFYIGRLRPNFYELCGFDPAILACAADPEDVRQARMSFPSGHSSLSFCSLSVVAWFLLGRSGIAARRGRWSSRRWESALAALPLKARAVASACGPWGMASIVAASRLVDNWHHPSDVIAGSMLGFAVGTFAYHLWYSHILSPDAGVPRNALNAEVTPATTGDRVLQKRSFFGDLSV